MVELIFENVESAIIPTEYCRFYFVKDKLIYLDFPLNKIKDKTYSIYDQSRVFLYNDIVYVEKDGKRYDVNWEDGTLCTEENKLQHTELLKNGKVRIWWEGK